MSIYVVPLYEWYPRGHAEYVIAKIIVEQGHCQMCGKKPKYRYSYGFHSLPWGHITDVWCSKKCLKDYEKWSRK